MLDFILTMPVQLQETRNKWTFQKNFVPQHGMASRLQVHRLHHTATTRLIWMKVLNVHLMYIYTINK